jgi:MoxR-like ATPase
MLPAIISDSIAITMIYLSAKLHKAFLLKGPAGSGKTQLTYAAAEAANTSVECFSVTRALVKKKPFGKFDEPL